MKDGRSITSRANLGKHIPQALDPQGAVNVCVRVPQHVSVAVDAAAQEARVTRAEWLREVIGWGLNRGK